MSYRWETGINWSGVTHKHKELGTCTEAWARIEFGIKHPSQECMLVYKLSLSWFITLSFFSQKSRQQGLAKSAASASHQFSPRSGWPLSRVGLLPDWVRALSFPSLCPAFACLFVCFVLLYFVLFYVLFLFIYFFFKIIFYL